MSRFALRCDRIASSISHRPWRPRRACRTSRHGAQTLRWSSILKSSYGALDHSAAWANIRERPDIHDWPTFDRWLEAFQCHQLHRYYKRSTSSEDQGFVRSMYQGTLSAATSRGKRPKRYNLEYFPLIIAYLRDFDPKDREFDSEVALICEFARDMTRGAPGLCGGCPPADIEPVELIHITSRFHYNIEKPHKPWHVTCFVGNRYTWQDGGGFLWGPYHVYAKNERLEDGYLGWSNHLGMSRTGLRQSPTASSSHSVDTEVVSKPGGMRQKSRRWSQEFRTSCLRALSGDGVWNGAGMSHEGNKRMQKVQTAMEDATEKVLTTLRESLPKPLKQNIGAESLASTEPTVQKAMSSEENDCRDSTTSPLGDIADARAESGPEAARMAQETPFSVWRLTLEAFKPTSTRRTPRQQQSLSGGVQPNARDRPGWSDGLPAAQTDASARTRETRETARTTTTTTAEAQERGAHHHQSGQHRAAAAAAAASMTGGGAQVAYGANARRNSSEARPAGGEAWRKPPGARPAKAKVTFASMEELRRRAENQHRPDRERKYLAFVSSWL